MDNESKFWLGITGIISAAIVLIVITGSLYWNNQSKIIAEMVKNGASPIAAMCATQDDYGKNPTCVVLATKEAQGK
jgi:hypothetical protein